MSVPLSLMLFNIIFLLPHPSKAQESTCHGPCVVLASPLPPSSDDCRSSGTLSCKDGDFPTYTCSPPVMPSTSAKLTLNNFSEGGEGSDPSECDGKFHENTELVVALSTGWFDNKARCFQTIIVTAVSNGMSVAAKVVDQCDSTLGCDKAHGSLPPCENNIVDGSAAVWEALSLDKDSGSAEVTWSTA
ncbi:hypothetical protein ACE6H2_019755 [Prunus campanulata]